MKHCRHPLVGGLLAAVMAAALATQAAVRAQESRSATLLTTEHYFDWERVRFTLDEPYVEAIMEEFRSWYERGLIYRGVRVVNRAGVQEADGDNYAIRDGVVLIPKGAVLPDGTVI